MSQPSPTLAIFTGMQRRVLEMTTAGRSLAEIASIAHISEWTVRHHLTNAAARVPDDFYPSLTGSKNRRARLLMFYALAVANEQLDLVA